MGVVTVPRLHTHAGPNLEKVSGRGCGGGGGSRRKRGRSWDAGLGEMMEEKRRLPNRPGQPFSSGGRRASALAGRASRGGAD